MSVTTKKRLLFLASGRGSNFAAVTDAVLQGRLPQAEVVGLICSRPQAPAITLAQERRIPVEILDSSRFRTESGFQREAWDAHLEEAIRPFRPDWICLAGYLLMLSDTFVRRWENRIINIHPSLLPAFPGLHAQRQALEAGVQWTGCTVHLVTEKLDAGPVFAQQTIPILDTDTEESLSQRLLPIEHATYIEALHKICERGFTIENGKVVWK